MKRLIDDNFKYERRKYIFLTVNTINLVRIQNDKYIYHIGINFFHVD